MSQYVVWFDSSETGAPVLNNAAGSLLAVLDACLVNGFNLKAVTSLVVAGGVATVTCAGHGFSGIYGKDVEVAGVTPAGLNGRKALTFVDTNTFRFDATGISDQTATGTITAKRSPLGWIKQFTGTNKAIYKRSDVTATAVMLRVDDTNIAPATATDARVVMVESATDVDTYTAPSPTSAQNAGGHYANKGSNNTVAKQWTVVGDGKRFFLVTQNGPNTLPAVNGMACQHFFGDFTSLKAGDAYNTVLFFSNTVFSGSNGYLKLASSDAPAISPFALVARAYAQVSVSIPVATQGIGNDFSGGPTHSVYPSPVDSGLVILPGMPIREYNVAGGNPVRGILKPLCFFMAIYPFNHQAIIDPVANLPGRKVLALAGNFVANPLQFGVDITGPWD